MRILAIETSCDETAIAILEAGGTKSRPKFNVRANLVTSQVAIHKKFGGVVPNLAKREHQKNLVPLLVSALKKTKLSSPSRTIILASMIVENIKEIFSHEPELLLQFIKNIPKILPPDIDAIAVTYGPGLAPALWTGVNFARALSLVWNKPIIPVNHLEGHIYINVLRGEKITFPALALIVSGGHTELVLMKKHIGYQIIGETRDDAAGEAFDKVAKLLGLGYPGGPEISALAEISQINADVLNADTRRGSRRSSAFAKGPQLSALRLPRPMIHDKSFDFSFSGLKTAVLYLLRDHPEFMKLKAEIACEFQNAVVETLVTKTMRAAKKYGIKTLILGGGVAANKKLRADLTTAVKKNLPETKLLLPEISETTDNALMIAVAAAFRKNKKSAWRHLRADPSLRLA